MTRRIAHGSALVRGEQVLHRSGPAELELGDLVITQLVELIRGLALSLDVLPVLGELFGSQVALLFAGAYQDLLSGLTGSVAPLSKLIYKCHETALSDISVAASGKAY
jgi:hypothetical protein